MTAAVAHQDASPTAWFTALSPIRRVAVVACVAGAVVCAALAFPMLGGGRWSLSPIVVLAGEGGPIVGEPAAQAMIGCAGFFLLLVLVFKRHRVFPASSRGEQFRRMVPYSIGWMGVSRMVMSGLFGDAVASSLLSGAVLGTMMLALGLPLFAVAWPPTETEVSPSHPS